MPTAIESLLAILDVEPLENDHFRGGCPGVGWQRVFGGQVIGQALAAATRTVDDSRAMHSLHAYFMRPGDPSVPIDYRVDRIRDGSSFTTRRVVAVQHGAAIYSMAASFQVHEDGLEHQDEMPADVPPPEGLASEGELIERMLSGSGPAPEHIRRYWVRERPIEFRPVNPRNPFSPERGDPVQLVWFRAAGAVPDMPTLHRCILAYATDYTLLDTALAAHGRSVFDTRMMVASLDHALWVHRPFRADDWLLYVQESPNASGARAFTRGAVFARDGRLVASVAQEGLIRQRTR